MPYIRIDKCVYKKRGKKRGKKKGCSSSAIKAKKYLKKLSMVGEYEDLEGEILEYFDQKVLNRKGGLLWN
jgi:hypothetical protein